MFQRQGERETFQGQWQPQWFLSHSGHKGITKECVHKVQSWGAENPEEFEKLDLQMKRSVELCMKALLSNQDHGMPLLVEALDMANDCFSKWGLVSAPLKDHMARLREAGALAMKPTGSGLGGYVLSLWKHTPEVSGIEFLKATVNNPM